MKLIFSDHAWEVAAASVHRSGVLAYFDHRIFTEGTNNKIKTMKRQAYGYRDMEFFKLKILGLHETKGRGRNNKQRGQPLTLDI